MQGRQQYANVLRRPWRRSTKVSCHAFGVTQLELREDDMPIPFLIAPLAALAGKTLGTIAAGAAVATVASAVAYDLYQEIKESISSQSDRKKNDEDDQSDREQKMKMTSDRRMP